ncbi:hypothetical protein HDU91_001432, partial [Kappamyces sp. JEL0680]
TANASALDMVFLDLVSRLVKGQHGIRSDLLDAKMMDVVFMKASRGLGLPVGSGASGLESAPLPNGRKGLSEYGVMDFPVGLSSSFHTSKSASFATIIVYSLEDPKTLSHLQIFIRSIESFAHPSNHGKWSASIAKLMLEISSGLFHRTWVEGKADCQIPKAKRLDPAHVRAAVVLVNRIVQMTLYGKDANCVSSSQLAFKYLVRLGPSIVFPGLLESAYPALQGLTETHRTISALGVLYTTSSALAKRSLYPEGGTSVVPLLMATLPGIDVNDISKSLTTLVWVFTILVHVPLIDTSKYPSSLADVEMVDGMSPTTTSDTNELVKSSTAEFETWVLKFMERIFTALENLPQNFGVGSHSDYGTQEGGLLDTIFFTTQILFNQCSDELEDVVLSLVAKKVKNGLGPAATEAIGYICSAICPTKPQKRLAKLLPLCTVAIREELESGAGSTRTGSRFGATSHPFDFATMSDATLHWYQSVLKNIVGNSGSALLQYRSDIEDILDLMIEKCLSKRGYIWAGQLLSGVLLSLTSIYPMEFRSHPPSVWDSLHFKKNAHLHWGETCDIENLEAQWHIPSPEEIQWAVSLAQKYLDLSMARLEQLQKSQEPNWSSEFNRWMALFSSCTSGIFTFVQPQGDFDHDGNAEYTST